MVDHIGDLDANTTIIVPVKITLKTRTKRVRRFVCGMLLIYDLLCGDVRSYSVDALISGGCGGVDGGSYAWSKNFIVIWMIWYVPIIVNTSSSFPHVWLITGFVTRLTQQVPLVEQELLTLPEYSIFSFMCMFCRSLFILFLLVIVLSVLFRFTDSDYPFDIFKLF